MSNTVFILIIIVHMTFTSADALVLNFYFLLFGQFGVSVISGPAGGRRMVNLKNHHSKPIFIMI